VVDTPNQGQPGGSDPGVSTDIAGALTAEGVATQYGLSLDQVEQFCREYHVAREGGGHYVIPPTMIPSLKTWAERKGFTLKAGDGT